MAKYRPSLQIGWDVDTFVLAKFLAKDANVLFIYNTDYDRIKKIVDVLNIKVSILHDRFEELERARTFGFDVVSGNINTGVLKDFNNKYFDYVVCENHLHSARYPKDILCDMCSICDHLVICNVNNGHWKKRLKFFLRGSLFVENQYDVIPDDNYAWFNKYPWCLSHKDIVNLCTCSELVIKKGTIIYNNGDIDNMYDVRSYPNWSAKKVYYLISSDTSIKPTYQFGGTAI